MSKRLEISYRRSDEDVPFGCGNMLLAVYEVEAGKWKLNYIPKNKLPIEEFLQPQGRFKHVFAKGKEHLIEELQKEVDQRWNELLVICGEKN